MNKITSISNTLSKEQFAQKMDDIGYLTDSILAITSIKNLSPLDIYMSLTPLLWSATKTLCKHPEAKSEPKIIELRDLLDRIVKSWGTREEVNNESR